MLYLISRFISLLEISKMSINFRQTKQYIQKIKIVVKYYNVQTKDNML